MGTSGSAAGLENAEKHANKHGKKGIENAEKHQGGDRDRR
jgi:hypothetical protein